MINPKDIVKEGYDKVSFTYREDSPDKNAQSYLEYKDWMGKIANLVKLGSPVLDLGCGCGVPATQLLADQYKVTGCDISPVQIERAKKLVPNASFICGDMCELDFPAESFDVIVSLYAIIHVPVEEQPALFKKVRDWLKPRGYLLAIVGQRSWTGTEPDWLGVKGAEMYWSIKDIDTYVNWLTQLNFTILLNDFIPEGNSGHTLLFAQKST